MSGDYKARLKALLEGLEAENIDALMKEKDPEMFRVIGDQIALAARRGAAIRAIGRIVDRG